MRDVHCGVPACAGIDAADNGAQILKESRHMSQHLRDHESGESIAFVRESGGP
jgi:hypothetical protein